MKRFFFQLILLLSIFNHISLADTEHSSISASHNNLSPNVSVASQLIQKMEQNSQNIQKNALGINKVKSNYNGINATNFSLNKKTRFNKSNITNIYDQLHTSDKKIEHNKKSIRHINRRLKTTEQTTEIIQKQVLQDAEYIKKNQTNISTNKASIEENNFLYKYGEENSLAIDKINNKLNTLNKSYGVTSDYLDRFWVLIAGVLVFFMQAGFKTFEAGMVRKVHNDNVAIKNILDWLIISLVYFLVGFGLMFGDSFNGLIGTNLFGPTAEVMENVKITIADQYLGLEFFIYQLAFAATAATIVSGAMSERIALIPYIALSVFIGTLIYPVFGHWAWGGTFYQNDQGWLYALGFRDFAGSTVVHSVGAWIALAGIIEIGPRIGRYDKEGNVNTKDFTPSNLGYSTLGVLILWFGWWGFNGGSQLKYDETIAPIILNTIIAGSAAGITAFFHALTQSRDKYAIFPKLLGGILGGLVAITASCNSVSPYEALFIGVAAGFIHNYSLDFLIYKLKLDDPVGAVAVHGFCGVWGTLCVAFFGQLDTDFFVQNNSLFYSEHSVLGFMENTHIRIQQGIIQLIGIITAFLFTFILSLAFFKMIRKVPGIGLRVLPSDEKRGSILGITN